MTINCSPLVNWNGIKNLGKAYTKESANWWDYTLAINGNGNLTYESLINILNNLYDLNLTYDVANGGTLYSQTIQLSRYSKDRLTAEEIAIATNKRLDCFVERRKICNYLIIQNLK
jgi:hypothetical protein